MFFGSDRQVRVQEKPSEVESAVVVVVNSWTWTGEESEDMVSIPDRKDRTWCSDGSCSAVLFGRRTSKIVVLSGLD